MGGDCAGLCVPYRGEDGALMEIEVAELVDGAVYAVHNVCEQAPEDDIAWRMAYRRQSVQVIRVDCETGSETVLHERVW